MTDAQSLEGDLRDVALPQVLKSLAIQQSTGILTVQGDDDIVAVSCLSGHIVTADSLNLTQEESLGALLVSEALVSKEDFDAVVLEHQESGDSLADLLVSRGLISREKLLECLRLQTYRLMLQVLTWSRGEFKFYGGDEVSYEKGVIPITVDELLIRALADLGDKSRVGGRVPALDAIYRKVPPRGPIHVHGRGSQGGPGIWITELQQAFLDKVDGQANAIEIARALRAGRFRTLFSLHQLLQNDLIEVAQTVERPAAGRAPTAAVRRPTGRISPRPHTGRTTAVGAPAPPAAAPPAAAPPDAAYPRPTAAVETAVASPPPAAPEPSSGKIARPQAEELAPPAPGQERTVVAATAAPGTPRAWIGPALAAVLLGLTVFGLFSGPSSFLLPFPWQQEQRATLERQVRQTLFRKIDRAIGTYCLLEFQYPRGLDDLVDRNLLAAADTWDPAGYALRYVPQEQSYLIELVAGGRTVETRSGAIAGDFILDRDYFAEEVVKNPLVLLD